MTTSLKATSELEAVNTMLNCINESPVSSLLVSGLVDVAVARSVLLEVSREVQEHGWHFNTEKDYPLNRDVDGKIKLGTDMVVVDTMPQFNDRYDVVQRGQRLYWLNAHTDIFDRDLKGEVVFLLPWDDLPQAARNYIMVRAARRFQSRQLGSETKHKFSEEEELRALAALQSAHMSTGDFNMFSGSWSVASIINR